MNKIKIFFTLTVLLLFTACEQNLSNITKESAYKEININLDNSDKESVSTEAANLITTAIKEELDVDVVFYPTVNLKENEINLTIDFNKSSLDEKVQPGIEELKSVYSTNTQEDSIIIAYMDGSAIKDFIVERSKENYKVDIHTAGVNYDVLFKGGILQNLAVSVDGEEIDDDKNYKVAFMLYEYGNNPDSGFMINFPGYYYKNGFSYMKIIPTDYKASELLEDYLINLDHYENFTYRRSRVRTVSEDELDYIIPVFEIQGDKYISDYIGKRVKTHGIITAVASDDYDNVYGFYLQDEDGDGDIYTSDGIFVKADHEVMADSRVKVGDKVEFIASVIEDFTSDNLSRTTLIDVDMDSFINYGAGTFPEAVHLGSEGDRVIPNTLVSSYIGDLNRSEKLNLEDGIGFWESLEGMRVEIAPCTVVGFSGGNEDKYSSDEYLSLYVRLAGSSNEYQITDQGGLIIDVAKNDYNPEIIAITDHPFKGLDGKAYGSVSYSGNFEQGGEKIFNVGDQLESVEGILDYNLNDFGSGEYAFFPMSEVDSVLERTSITPISERKHTALTSDDEHLTIGTFNIENLGGLESDGNDSYSSKWNDIGQIIGDNMSSPDILVFTEVQDNDGNAHSTVTDASLSLKKIISGIEKAGGATDYKFININPIAYSDGGEPGGNIRVAAIYRDTRVTFSPRGVTGEKIIDDNNGEVDESSTVGSELHVGLDENGHLLNNPGRVYPNAARFAGTRKLSCPR